MPSLAFAAVAEDVDNGITYDGHKYAVTVTTGTVTWSDVQEAVKETSKVKDYVEVVTAPAHGVAGKAKLTCTSYGCDKTIEVKIGELSHEEVAGNQIDKDFTLEEFAAQKVAEKPATGSFVSEESAANWLKTVKAANACYMKAKVCPCGKIMSFTPVYHTNSSCGDVTCPQCGEVIKGSGSHTWVNDTPAVKVDANCGHGEGYEATCSVCGTKGINYGATDTPSATAVHNYGTPVAFADATVKEKSGSSYVYKVKAGYVAVSRTIADEEEPDAVLVPGATVGFETTAYDFFKSNKVVTAPTCEGPGVGTLECSVCGKALKDDNGSEDAADVVISIPKSGHDYAETEVAATCDSNAYTLKKCTVCKHEEKAYKANTKLAHNYVVTKTSPSCKGGEVYTVKCSTCKDCSHADIVADKTFANTNFTKYAEDTDTITYLCRGFGGSDLSIKDAIQLTYSKKAVGHKYGKKELLRKATCTSNEVWGYKCTECGKLAVHEPGYAVEYKLNTKAAHDFVKTEVAATCGKAGYSYEQCSVCNVYKKGSSTDTNLEADGVKTAIKPVVKTGAACTFDKWVVTKKPTVFEKGVEALVCSVCGADGHENEAIDKLTVAKASNTVKAGKKSFNVKSSAANATGYRVYYKKAGAKSWKSYTKKTDSLSKTFSGLSKGKYYVKVKAYAKNYAGDGEVVWGATSSTKSVKVK